MTRSCWRRLIFRACLASLLACSPLLPARAALTPSSSALIADFRSDWQHLLAQYPHISRQDFIVVDVVQQKLYLFQDASVTNIWPVSTSLRGMGNRLGSLQTPTGAFEIIGKIGRGFPLYAELNRYGRVGNMLVTPVLSPDTPRASQEIIGRILMLKGLEPGWNGNSTARHIYIHGTADIGQLGEPVSDGCVQMAPRAIVRLFRLVPRLTPVLILPGIGNLQAIPGEIG